MNRPTPTSPRRGTSHAVLLASSPRPGVVFCRFSSGQMRRVAVSRVCPRTAYFRSFVENFVELGHFQRNLDKEFRQRLATKLGTSLLGQALSK
jgi:hypothetical protein